ncbi:MAG: lytic transglycosylase domain-containing protein, partial [Proteobacteria bacterium]|nr:lytic transglycosylase domain-containing protein [Pseudomonadota bacterium]
MIGKFFKNEFSVKSDEILSAFTNNKWILNFFRHRITKFIYLIKSENEKLKWINLYNTTKLSPDLEFIKLNIHINQSQSNIKDKYINRIAEIWSKTILINQIENEIESKYIKFFSSNILKKKIELLIFKEEYNYAKRISKLKKDLYIYNKILEEKEANHLNEASKNHIKYKEIKNLVEFLYLKQLMKAGKEDELLDVVLNIDTKNYNLYISRYVKISIKNAINTQRYIDALTLIERITRYENHCNQELELMAGFVKLRFLYDSTSAIPHFQRAYSCSKFSHSKSQSMYWLARAFKQQNDIKTAQEYFKKVANQYIWQFYGQMAAFELNAISKNYNQIIHSIVSCPNNIEETNIAILDKRLRFIIFLAQNGLSQEAQLMVKNIINKKIDNNSACYIIQKLKSLNTHSYVVSFTKILSKYKSNSIYIDGYPTLNKQISNQYQYQNSNWLYLSIIRQESDFDSNALSNAGASGIMQIMPLTAKAIAKKYGILYKDNLYHQDTNLYIGMRYFDDLAKIWNGNLPLIAANYNAGEKPVRRWISQHGDARTFNHVYQLLDWIESISYDETKFYIKKIIENS